MYGTVSIYEVRDFCGPNLIIYVHTFVHACVCSCVGCVCARAYVCMCVVGVPYRKPLNCNRFSSVVCVLADGSCTVAFLLSQTVLNVLKQQPHMALAVCVDVVCTKGLPQYRLVHYVQFTHSHDMCDLC